MGGSNSKSVVNLTSEIITRVSIKIGARYETSIKQDQKTVIVNNGFSFWDSTNMKQSSTINSQAMMQSNVSAELKNELFNELKNAATTEGIAVLDAFGNTRSEAETNMKQTIDSTVQISSILETVNKIEQNQDFARFNNGVSIYASLDQIQGAEIFAEAVLKSFNDAGVFNKMENNIESNAATKTTNPLAFLVDIIKGITATPFMIIGGVILIIAAIAIMVRGRRSPAQPIENRNPRNIDNGYRDDGYDPRFGLAGV